MKTAESVYHNNNSLQEIANNKYLKTLIFSLIILTAILHGCKKYPDGPGLSIEPKIFRFTSEWNLDKGIINGVDQTDSIKTTYPFYHLTVEREKSYTISWTTAYYSVEYYEHGTWEWVENKESIHFKYEGNGSTGLYGTHAAYPTYPGEYTIRILRLKEKELWYKWTLNNGDVWELHFTKPIKQR